MPRYHFVTFASRVMTVQRSAMPPRSRKILESVYERIKAEAGIGMMADVVVVGSWLETKPEGSVTAVYQPAMRDTTCED
jgi:hypothetical protein